MLNQTALTPSTPATTALALGDAGYRLVAAFLAGRSPRTLDAYRRDLDAFHRFLGVDSNDAAAAALLGRSHGEANAITLDYRNSMVDAGLAAATVNRRLAALRSLVKLARTLGMVPWKLEVEGLRAQPYRDTRGPGRDGIRALVVELEARDGAKARRDLAAVRLMYDCGLRRGEVVSLDVEDLDLTTGIAAVLGKGRTEKEPVTLPEPTMAALRSWLEARGTRPGAVFVNFDRAGKGQRLTGRSLHRIVKRIGAAVGLEVWPHGLRHSAITQALDATNGNVRKVQRFSRHRDIRVLSTYDDNRRDDAGEVARLVAAGV